MQWERNGNGSRLSDGLDPSSDPAGGSRVETSQSNYPTGGRLEGSAER